VKLLTAEAARILNLTPATVRQMERRGLLPAELTDKGVRIFDREVVLRIARERAERRAVPPTPEDA
jgi:DNA-binding transcriptional MerR regulator